MYKLKYDECVKDIMDDISDRRGFDIYSCEEGIVADIKGSLVRILKDTFENEKVKEPSQINYIKIGAMVKVYFNDVPWLEGELVNIQFENGQAYPEYTIRDKGGKLNAVQHFSRMEEV